MEKRILEILNELYTKKLTPEKAFEKIKYLPYEDINYAKIDFHRKIRTGIEEIIFGMNKSLNQLIEIIKTFKKNNQNVLITKIDKEKGEELKNLFPEGIYSEIAQIFYIKKIEKIFTGNILIITAGTSDIPVAEEAYITAQFLGSNVEKIYDVGVAGLHRLLNFKEKIKNSNIIIAVAGMEGALPSVVAGLFGKPVIGVPTSIGYGANLNGFSSLLTMLNSCAPGVVVVNIDNGVGAAIFAHLINQALSEKC